MIWLMLPVSKTVMCDREVQRKEGVAAEEERVDKVEVAERGCVVSL